MLVEDLKKFIAPATEMPALEIAEQYLESCVENVPIVLNNLIRNQF
jgi:hypothetical protein